LNNLLENLNDRQQEAVLHIEGPALVLAGAGSGKTGVLTRRVAYLMREKGVKPWNILAVTFTNKAAGEMKERIVNLAGFDTPRFWISTFHSSSVRILRREIERLGFSSNFVIFDTSEQKTLIRECLKELNISEKILPYQRVMNRIGMAKNDLVSPEDYEKHFSDYYQSPINEIYMRYQRKLKQNNALDFDDLIFFVVKLFRRHRDVLEKYRDLFKYILIDEYQDINRAQYELVKALAGKHRNLFVVGDEDQSIYAFRGADMNIIMNFESDFPEARIIKLEQNYRSTRNILETANQLVCNNYRRRKKALWTSGDEGKKPLCYEAIDEKDEAIFVVDEIKKLSRLEDRKLNDFVILYRTNAQSRVFEEVLICEGLPYQIIGGLKFYDRKEIKDILAYLRVLYNPSDLMALRRIINLPPRGIGAKTLDKLVTVSEDTGRNLYDFLDNEEFLRDHGFKSRHTAPLSGFKRLMESFHSLIDAKGIAELLEEVMEKSGYRKSLSEENTVEAVTRLENLEELQRVAQEYDNKKGTLEDFLALTTLTSDIDMIEDKNQVVTLMTVHSAKGLEYPVVFLTGMEEGLFPHRRSIDTGKESDIEEERRLAYVAITRAREKLYLSYAWRRLTYGGGSVYNDLSRFLQEIASSIERPFGEKDLFGSSKTSRTETSSSSSKVVSKKVKTSLPVKNAFYRRGDNVKHRDFGRGVILDVMGGGQMKVSFPKVGLRKVDAESLVSY